MVWTRRVWGLCHTGLGSLIGSWGFTLDNGQLWPQLYSGRITGQCKGESVKEGTNQRQGGQRDAVAIIQGSDEAPRTRHSWLRWRWEGRLRLFPELTQWDSLSHSMGGEGEFGVTACCWVFEEVQSPAPFLLPKFWTDWEIKQAVSNIERKTSLSRLLKLMLENVACISGKCAASYCTLESRSALCLAEMDVAPCSYRQCALRERRENNLGTCTPCTQGWWWAMAGEQLGRSYYWTSFSW